MDVESGDFKFDFHTGRASSSVAKNGFLDPELANEGEKAGDKIILSDGEQVSWSPPQVKPVMPDWSTIKSLAKYFNREGKQTWPCWFYHASLPPVLIKDAEEAFSRFGIRRRKASDRERALQGAGEWVWDTPEDCEWQPAPFSGNVPGKFNPDVGAAGKNYMPKAADPQVAQNALIAQLIPTVTAAVVTALQGNASVPAAPAGFGSADWEEFQRYLAFKKTQEAVAPLGGALNAGTGDDDRPIWEAQAKELGLKIDGRWSLDRLRKEVGAELDKRAAAQGDEAA